jgi:superfamily II DNA/RNA helicase
MQVINFDLCDPQRYMQRIGRVGRFGRAGTAISLIPPYQVRALSCLLPACCCLGFIDPTYIDT